MVGWNTQKRVILIFTTEYLRKCPNFSRALRGSFCRMKGIKNDISLSGIVDIGGPAGFPTLPEDAHILYFAVCVSGLPNVNLISLIFIVPPTLFVHRRRSAKGSIRQHSGIRKMRREKVPGKARIRCLFNPDDNSADNSDDQ